MSVDYRLELRAELRRGLAALEERLEHELEALRHELTISRDVLEERLEHELEELRHELTERIDLVHKPALRALTRAAERRRLR